MYIVKVKTTIPSIICAILRKWIGEFERSIERK